MFSHGRGWKNKEIRSSVSLKSGVGQVVLYGQESICADAYAGADTENSKIQR